MVPGLQIGWLVVSGEQLTDRMGGREEKYVSIYLNQEVEGEERDEKEVRGGGGFSLRLLKFEKLLYTYNDYWLFMCVD